MAKSWVATITIENVATLEKGDTIHDDRVRGFEALGRSKGPATYGVRGWFKGKKANHVIGRAGSPWTPTTARTEARAVQVKWRQGINPREQKRQERDPLKVAPMCERYIAAVSSALIRKGPRKGLPKKPNTIARYNSDFRWHVQPLLGAKLANMLTTKEVETFRDQVIDPKTDRKLPPQTGGGRRVRGGKDAARNAVLFLQAAFNWAISQHLVQHNPCIGVETPPAGGRERVLKDEELFRLGHALRTAPLLPVELAAIKFNVLTGWRISEVCELRWSEVDPGKRVAVLPDTKTGKSHRILSTAACDVLRAAMAWRTADDGPVFPPMNRKHYHLDRRLERVCKLADLKGVTSHVFRHTLGSAAADLEYQWSMVEALLGHVTGRRSVTHGYVHRSDRALMAAADAIGRHLLALMGEGSDGDNVVRTAFRQVPTAA